MYKALIAVCVVSQFNVDGGGSCYLLESPDLFKSQVACMMANEGKRQKVHSDFVKLNGERLAVISQIGCKREVEASHGTE